MTPDFKAIVARAVDRSGPLSQVFDDRAALIALVREARELLERAWVPHHNDRRDAFLTATRECGGDGENRLVEHSADCAIRRGSHEAACDCGVWK